MTKTEVDDVINDACFVFADHNYGECDTRARVSKQCRCRRVTVSATRRLLLKPLVRCLRGKNYRMRRARTAAPAHHWAALAVRSIALAPASIWRGGLQDVNAGRPVGEPPPHPLSPIRWPPSPAFGASTPALVDLRAGQDRDVQSAGY